MLIIGWDWASDKHDLVVLDDAGNVGCTWRIAHSGAALAQLAAQLAERCADATQVHIGIEDHEGPLIGALQALGYQLHVLNGKQVQAARTAFCNSAAKDDLRDARVIARMLHRDLAAWRVAGAVDVPAQQLRASCELHDALTAQATRVQQQLRARLMLWLPELNRLLPQLTGQWAVELLRRWPLPQHWGRVDPRTWQAFYRRHRLSHAKRAALQQLIHGCGLMPVPPERQAALASELQALAEQLQLLTRQLARLARATDDLWHDYPDRELFETLPIAPGYLLHRLACAVGSDRRLPLSWQQTAIATGVAPITIGSGKFRCVKRRRGCDQRAQQALTWFAFQSTRTQTWAKLFYQQQRQRGRAHNTALRQLARKWLRILHSLWYHQTAYDPTRPNTNTTA